MEKPLHVRVAEALGWTACENGWVFSERRWCGTAPERLGGFDGFGRREIPHYDTDWSATGPLIERLRIDLKAPVNPDGERPWCLWDATCEDSEFDAACPIIEGETPLIAICNLILALHAAGPHAALRR